MTDKEVVMRDLRRKIMAAMETGNEAVARTALTELRAYDFMLAQRLRSEVIAAYGTDIQEG